MPNTKIYDPDTDYMLLIREAEAAGDYAAAAQYEKQRNAKIAGEGLSYEPTSRFAQYLPENHYTFDPTWDAEYVSAKADMDRAFRALTESGEFSYDPEADPVYQAYAERYLRQGRDAMEDTMGAAANLTGGYGSTYAQTAAQKAYEGYLGRLNDVLPDLYGAAYKRHRQEQSDAAAHYGYAKAAADSAYDRAYTRWLDARNLERADADAAERAAAEAAALERAEAEKAERYAREDAEKAEKRAQEKDKRAREDAAAAKEDARRRKDDLAQMIFKTGYRPTNAELAAAGMTRAEAEAWRMAYYRNLWS